MTKEDLPITPPPRDPSLFTALDGARLFAMIDSNLKNISSSFESFSNRLAISNKNDIKVLELLQLIESEFSDSRIGRLELEIEEAERERDLARKKLEVLDENLTKRQGIKDKNQDTGERLRVVASEAISDIEKRRAQDRATQIDKIKWALIQAIVITFGVGLATGAVGLAWFLIQLYMNRPGP